MCSRKYFKYELGFNLDVRYKTSVLFSLLPVFISNDVGKIILIINFAIENMRNLPPRFRPGSWFC